MIIWLGKIMKITSLQQKKIVQFYTDLDEKSFECEYFIFRLIVNNVRKITVAKACWLTLSSALLFAELPDLRRPIHGNSHSEVRTTEDKSLKLSHLLLRNARRLTSPNYLPNLLWILDRFVKADSNKSCGQKDPGINCSR